MNNMDMEIDFYRNKWKEGRDKLMHSILDAIVDEKSFWTYYPMLHGVIPADGFRSDCPENLKPWFDQTDHKEAVRYFDNLLESFEEYREEDLEQYFYKDDAAKFKDIFEKNSTWDLMQQIVEYTLQHQRCGATFDW